MVARGNPLGLRTLDDLRRTTNDIAFVRWPTLLPLIGSVYWLTAVPSEVRRAKQMRGLGNTTQNLALYFLFPVFALQRDLNELAR